MVTWSSSGCSSTSYTLTYTLKTSAGGAYDPAIFTFVSSNTSPYVKITINPTDITKATGSPINMALTVTATCSSNSKTNTTNWSLTVDSHCRTTTLNEGTVNAMTISKLKVYNAVTDLQTLVKWSDAASQTYGN